MSVNIIFRIAAVGILVTILVQVLKHSGRDEQAFLITLAGLILVLGWVIPYKFGSESVTYEGVGATKKWERIESYGPKFVENIVQAISRDILMYAIRTLSHCFICGHVHDEPIIECSKDVSLDVICEQMERTPPWIPGILLRADGYETEFYKKD